MAVATDRPVRNLSVRELGSVLATQVRGASPVGLEINTEYRMKGGKSCPYKGRVRKATRLAGFMGFDYQRAVNRRQVAEGKAGDFVPSKRPWGERVEGTPLVEHDGKLYLEYTPMHYGDSSYYLDGRPVVDPSVVADIESWGVDRSDNAAHQGLSKEFPVRTVALENVRVVRFGGEDVIVHKDVPAPPVFTPGGFLVFTDGEFFLIMGRLAEMVR